MKTGDIDFHFPVLGFTTDSDVWGFPDLRSLTTCGPLTLKDDMQAGMELVDSEGLRWIVRGVTRTGPAGSLISRLARALLSGKPQSLIEHDLDRLEPLTLNQVQARVCGAMEAHPLFWCEEVERESVLPGRLREVRATKRIAEIHEVLGLDTFEGY